MNKYSLSKISLFLLAVWVFAGCKDDQPEPTPSVEPIAAFTIAGGNCEAPCEVVFTNSSSNATSYTWDFGDGSAASTDESPTHTYQTGGTFTVKLTAKNDDGVSSEATKEVVITAKAIVDINDPNAVSASLGIEGATNITGTPPAPTNNGALALETPEEVSSAITGQDFYIPVLERDTDPVAGVYLAVKGSNSYWDIPAASLQNGRLSGVANERRTKTDFLNQRRKADEDFYINIPIPDNLEPGTVCFEYCVYDAENNVSNIVEVCIEILPFGGEGAEFLSATEWETYYEIDSYDGVNDTTWYPDTYSYEYYVDGLGCDSTANMWIELSEAEEAFWSFGANGGFLFKSIGEEEYVDYDNSTCDDIQTSTSPYESQVLGGWSYNAATSRAQIAISRYKDTWVEDGVTYEEEYTDTYVVEVEVSRDGDMVILKFVEDGDVYTTVLRPKR